MSKTSTIITTHSPDQVGESRRPAGLTPSSFALLLAILWGGNNVSIKVALGHGSPMQIGWIRFVIGGMSRAGVLAVVFGDTGVNHRDAMIHGDILSLISAILLGIRTVMISNFAQKVSEAKLMLGQLVIGTLLLLVGSCIFESPTYTSNGSFWFALTYQGAVIAGIGFLGTAWLLKHYLPSSVTFFFFAKPVAGVILAWLILGEDPSRGLIVGVALVCVGALAFSGESYLKMRRLQK